MCFNRGNSLKVRVDKKHSLYFVVLESVCTPRAQTHTGHKRYRKKDHVMIYNAIRWMPQNVCGTPPTWECISHAPIVTRIPIVDDIGIETGVALAPTEGFVLVSVSFVLMRVIVEYVKERVRKSRDEEP